MRGERMFEANYVSRYDLLSFIPSVDDPTKSIKQDTLEFTAAFPWNNKARLVDTGKIIDSHSMGFNKKDELELLALTSKPERASNDKRISDVFSEHFFTTNFWHMWKTLFAFEPYHSAIEMRRYLLIHASVPRYLHSKFDSPHQLDSRLRRELSRSVPRAVPPAVATKHKAPRGRKPTGSRMLVLRGRCADRDDRRWRLSRARRLRALRSGRSCRGLLARRHHDRRRRNRRVQAVRSVGGAVGHSVVARTDVRVAGEGGVDPCAE